MATAEEKVVMWLEYVKDWLNNDWVNKREDSALSKPASLLVRKLERDCDRSEMKAAWDVIRDLEDLGDKSEQLEAAEIQLNCGLAAARMGSFKEAEAFFLRASSKYAGFMHRQAIALWMAGCIQWLLPGKEVEAIGSWRSAVKAFENLRKEKENQKAAFSWYDERCTEMNPALEEAADTYEIPSPPNPVAGFSKKEGSANSQSRNDGNHFARMGLLPVYEHIKAGDFGTSGILSLPSGSLEVERVFIADKPFRILSLKGKKFFRAITRDFILIKVSGDSMNEADIQNGDFVLLKLLPKDISDYSISDIYSESNSQPPRMFNDGDIVAAEIANVDETITLKRIIHRSKKIILRAESTNPEYAGKSWEFDEGSDGFFIGGVAIAVLKPL